MRELSPDLLPNDAITVWVVAGTWHCHWCAPAGGDGAGTTVEWVGQGDGPDGRCRTCGAKFRLAKPYERVPSIAEQLGYTAEEVLGGDPS